MHPVITTIGSLSISSFGVFLALGLLSAIFIIWRLAKVYDLNEEKALDLVLLTFFGGLIGARLYFVVWHWEAFGDFNKALLINRYPGLSFWGGLLGGMLALWFFTSRTKLNFWQIADFAAVGTLIGLAIGDIGCFLGGCSYGSISNLPIAAPVIGLLGKRLPIALFESLLLFLAFFYLWGMVRRFHFAGKIASLFLIILGLIKFGTEFFRGDSWTIPHLGWVANGHILSLLVLVCGVLVFYSQSKRKISSDLQFLGSLFTSGRRRATVLQSLQKSWYNHKIGWQVSWSGVKQNIRSAPRLLRRKLHVKPTPTNYS